MPKNKVKYGLKNVHYAPGVINSDGSATYEAFKPWPGAVSMTRDAQGDTTKFRADNVDYWVGQSNNGYEGEYECALIPDDFRVSVLGEILNSDGVYLEDAGAKTKIFALAWQFEGDVHNTRHIAYNCTATRPSDNGQTTAEAIEPQTETITITSVSVYVPAIDKDIVKARCTQESAAYDTWFDAVYMPSDVTPPTTTYTVTFNTNGGTDVEPQTVEEGQTATEPTAPTKGSDTFGGWYSDSGLTTAYNFSTPVTADITLYAKWTT